MLKSINHLYGIAAFVGTSILVSSSALAATFANSLSSASVFNFSHQPQQLGTSVNQLSQVLGSTTGTVATTSVDAVFDDEGRTCADLQIAGSTCGANFSNSLAAGNQGRYFAQSQSQAGINGLFFTVQQNETFSFGLNAFLQIIAQATNPGQESAKSQGNILFQIYDTTDESQPPQLLDYLALFGAQTAQESQAGFGIQGTSAFNLTAPIIQTSNSLAVNGSFSRTFDRTTQLAFFEVKNNQAIVAVPEPSLVLPSGLLSILLIRLTLRRTRRFSSKSDYLENH